MICIWPHAKWGFPPCYLVMIYSLPNASALSCSWTCAGLSSHAMSGIVRNIFRSVLSPCCFTSKLCNGEDRWPPKPLRHDISISYLWRLEEDIEVLRHRLTSPLTKPSGLSSRIHIPPSGVCSISLALLDSRVFPAIQTSNCRHAPYKK